MLNELIKQPQSADIIKRIKELEQELDELLKEEEIWWAQRSQANWLTYRDKNTKSFHQKASQWKHRNWIDQISNDVGIIYEDDEKIEEIVNSFFIQLFTSEHIKNIQEVTEVVKGRINDNMLNILNAKFA